MSNTSETYILKHDDICRREVSPAITGRDAPLIFRDWLNKDLEFHQVWEALLRPIGPGVRFVAYFHGSSWGSEFNEILEYCPQLKPRNETVSVSQDGIIRVLNKRYSFGSDFPPGYDSCLKKINFPGWQFFSYDEMEMIVEGIRKFFASEEEIIYEPEWQEIILDHEKYEYDLFLIVHMV